MLYRSATSTSKCCCTSDKGPGRGVPTARSESYACPCPYPASSHVLSRTEERVRAWARLRPSGEAPPSRDLPTSSRSLLQLDGELLGVRHLDIVAGAQVRDLLAIDRVVDLDRAHVAFLIAEGGCSALR